RQVAVVRELEPRRDVRVVVELGAEDLVARPELAAGRAREGEAQRGHVRAEDRLLGRAAEEPRGGRPRVRLERLGAAARLVRPADVRVRLAQVRRDRVDHLVRNLRAARRVEEDQVALERGEPRPDGGDVEGHGRRFSHAARSSLSRSAERPALPVHSGTSRAVSARGLNVSPASSARSTGVSWNAANSVAPGAIQQGRSLQPWTPCSSRKPSSTQTTSPAPLASSIDANVSARGGEVALNGPERPSSTSRIVQSARSRTSIIWTGWSGGPGARIGPPRRARCGQYVKRSVGSFGPTIRPGRTRIARSPNARSASCSHSAFSAP